MRRSIQRFPRYDSHMTHKNRVVQEQKQIDLLPYKRLGTLPLGENISLAEARRCYSWAFGTRNYRSRGKSHIEAAQAISPRTCSIDLLLPQTVQVHFDEKGNLCYIDWDPYYSHLNVIPYFEKEPLLVSQRACDAMQGLVDLCEQQSAKISVQNKISAEHDFDILSGVIAEEKCEHFFICPPLGVVLYEALNTSYYRIGVFPTKDLINTVPGYDASNPRSLVWPPNKLVVGEIDSKSRFGVYRTDQAVSREPVR